MRFPPLKSLLPGSRVRLGFLPLLAVPALLLGAAADRTALTGASRVPYAAKCDPVPTPRALTSVDAVLDSTALMAGLAAISTDVRDEVTLSIRFGGRPTGHVVDVAQPSPMQSSLLDLVLASVRSGGAAIATRVVVLPGPTPVVRLDRSILCAPEARGGGSGSRQPAVVGRVTSSAPGGVPTQPREVRARVRISDSGNVLAVEILQGSGYAEIDRAVRESSLSKKYTPALLDGRPVEVWLTENRVELVR
jgi:hypothetical protein